MEHIKFVDCALELGVTVEALLLAAAEGHVKAWALMSAPGYFEWGYYEPYDPDWRGPFWVPSSDRLYGHQMFGPLDEHHAGTLLRQEVVEISFLSMDAVSPEIEGEKIRWDFDPAVRVTLNELYIRAADLRGMRELFGDQRTREPSVELRDRFIPDSPVYDRLLAILKAFPQKYPDHKLRPPKLYNDVHDWLKEKPFPGCNSSEVLVFGTVIRDHFKLLTNSRKT